MRLKIFFSALILSLPFWWGVNVFSNRLEDFLFSKEIAKTPQLFTAQIAAGMVKSLNVIPVRNPEIPDPIISARSAISVLFDSSFTQREILFQKNSDQQIPIASLSKLIAAYVASENYDLSQVVEISKNAIKQDEAIGNFKIGEKFTVKDLLYSSLIESSNDAMYALSEVVGPDAFVELMNLESQKILGPDSKTHFVNPTGLTPPDRNQTPNSSSAQDLVKLSVYLLKEKPLIWEILNNQEFDLYSLEGSFHHLVVNTDELLGKIPGIVGGKTGNSDEAGGCLLLILKSPYGKGFIVNVVLGSNDRFGDMKKIVDWEKTAYK